MIAPIHRIISNPNMQQVKNKAGNAVARMGERISGTIESGTKVGNGVKKVINAFEANGVDNSFFGMATLMFGAVLLPRVITASKRNPDNKEATKDEITEIACRDLTTIATMLFGLKALKAITSGVTSKLNGLPMTNKPYKKFFETQQTGFKGILEKGKEIIQHPIQKAKTLFGYVVDTLNPLGGVKSLSKEQFIAKYSNYSSSEEVGKMFEDIANQGGKGQNAKGAKKVFDKLMRCLVDEQGKDIATQRKLFLSGVGSKPTEEPTLVLARLKELQEAGISGIKSIYEGTGKTPQQELIDEKVGQKLVEFFKDDKNEIVMDALKLDAVLKTGALGIESLFLGFGLPAINQRRLEKKYIKNTEADKQKQLEITYVNPLVDRNIKAQEIKIFSSFIK